MTAPTPYIAIIFDGPPGPTPGRFVEVESWTGASIELGDWVERQDGFWELRITMEQFQARWYGMAVYQGERPPPIK